MNLDTISGVFPHLFNKKKNKNYPFFSLCLSECVLGAMHLGYFSQRSSSKGSNIVRFFPGITSFLRQIFKDFLKIESLSFPFNVLLYRLSELFKILKSLRQEEN